MDRDRISDLREGLFLASQLFSGFGVERCRASNPEARRRIVREHLSDQDVLGQGRSCRSRAHS